MIIVEGYVRLANAADIDRLKSAAEAQIAASRAEVGCHGYAYAVDLIDPTLMRVSETWASWDVLESHFQEPHMSVWRAALKDITFVERSLRAHEVSNTRDL